MLFALRHFVGEFYGLDSSDSSLPLATRIRNARERMIEFPEAVTFYHKWRVRESWLCPEFIAVEKQFQRNLLNAYPRLTEEQTLAIHVAIHGIVTLCIHGASSED